MSKNTPTFRLLSEYSGNGCATTRNNTARIFSSYCLSPHTGFFLTQNWVYGHEQLLRSTVGATPKYKYGIYRGTIIIIMLHSACTVQYSTVSKYNRNEIGASNEYTPSWFYFGRVFPRREKRDNMSKLKLLFGKKYIRRRERERAEDRHWGKIVFWLGKIVLSVFCICLSY